MITLASVISVLIVVLIVVVLFWVVDLFIHQGQIAMVIKLIIGLIGLLKVLALLGFNL